MYFNRKIHDVCTSWRGSRWLILFPYPGCCQMCSPTKSDTADSEIRWLAIGWPLFENFSSNELWWVKLQLLSSLTLPRLTCRSFSFGYVYEYCTHHLAIANDLIWRGKWVLFLLFCTVVFSRIWVFFFNWSSRLTFSIALHSNVAWFSDVVFLKSKYMYSRPALRASLQGGRDSP